MRASNDLGLKRKGKILKEINIPPTKAGGN
jgi:hypothetical protein